MINMNLEIAKEAAEIKLDDATGTLTIESALNQAQRNFNRLKGLSQIIKAMRGGEEDD
jgi:hypothetical protein